MIEHLYFLTISKSILVNLRAVIFLEIFQDIVDKIDETFTILSVSSIVIPGLVLVQSLAYKNTDMGIKFEYPSYDTAADFSNNCRTKGTCAVFLHSNTN